MIETRQYQIWIHLVICFLVIHECFFDPTEECDPIVFHLRVVPQELANKTNLNLQPQKMRDG